MQIRRGGELRDRRLLARNEVENWIIRALKVRTVYLGQLVIDVNSAKLSGIVGTIEICRPKAG